MKPIFRPCPPTKTTARAVCAVRFGPVLLEITTLDDSLEGKRRYIDKDTGQVAFGEMPPLQ